VVAQCCDKVVVLYAGRVVEARSTGPLFDAPAHPYTRALISCIPRDGLTKGTLQGIAGSVPTVSAYPSGCRYHPRCEQVYETCRRSVPPAARVVGGTAACHLLTVGETVHG